MHRLRCIAGGANDHEVFDDESDESAHDMRTCMTPGIGLYGALKRKARKKAPNNQEHLNNHVSRRPSRHQDSPSRHAAAKPEGAPTKQECAPAMPSNHQTATKRVIQPPKCIEVKNNHQQGVIQSPLGARPTTRGHASENTKSQSRATYGQPKKKQSVPIEAKQILKELFLIEEDRMIEVHLSELAASLAEPLTGESTEKDTANAATSSLLDSDDLPKLEYTPIVRDKRVFPPAMKSEGDKVAFSHELGLQVIRSLDTEESASDDSSISSLSNDIRDSIKNKKYLVHDSSQGSDGSFEIDDETFEKRHAMSTQARANIDKSISKIRHHLGHDFNQEMNDSFQETKAIVVPNQAQPFEPYGSSSARDMGEIDIDTVLDPRQTTVESPQRFHFLKFDDEDDESSSEASIDPNSGLCEF